MDSHEKKASRQSLLHLAEETGALPHSILATARVPAPKAKPRKSAAARSIATSRRHAPRAKSPASKRAARA